MMWVAKYWKQIAIAALIAVLCVAWRIDRASQYREGKAAATAHISAALAKQATAQQTAAHKASTEYQAEKAAAEQKERIRYVEVQKIVERPVYVQHCIDDYGLRELNAAIADGN